MTQPAPAPSTTIPPAILARMLEDVHADTPSGYENFYFLLWNRPVPEHVMKEWIEPIYKLPPSQMVFIEAFRGSTKTTSITNTLAAYKHGNYPDKSGLFIQSGDDTATKNSKVLRDIIAQNLGWKVCFPHIVPDYERGWSENGYNIKDDRVPYGEWVRRLSKDP
jgi:hypothetical protein